MATKVTIEGSRITPTVKLPAGVRTTVLLTPDVQNFINRGFAVLIRSDELPDEVVQDASDGDTPDWDASGEAPDTDRKVTEVPARNASQATWSKFLTDAGIDHDPEADRKDLIALWDENNKD